MLPHSTYKETNFSVGSSREAIVILPADSYYSHAYILECDLRNVTVFRIVSFTVCRLKVKVSMP